MGRKQVLEGIDLSWGGVYGFKSTFFTLIEMYVLQFLFEYKLKNAFILLK